MKTTDTADRLRTCDELFIDGGLAEQHPTAAGKWLLVEEITDAGNHIHPARLAVTVVDPHGPLFGSGNARTVYLYAGETCTYRVHNPHMLGTVGIRPGGVR